jgi:hypothetical protein
LWRAHLYRKVGFTLSLQQYLTKKLVRSISVIIDPSIRGGEYRYHLM